MCYQEENIMMVSKSYVLDKKDSHNHRIIHIR